jgi:hypothetical protein
MRQLTFAFCFLLASTGCGKVNDDIDGSPGDHRSDGGGGDEIADAGGPDATPVACDGPEDCMNPEDPCLLPGTCEGNVCHFETVDCSDLDTECTRGVCEDSECLARPVNEGDPCGGGTMDCGAFSDCGGFADTCDESGTQSRSCTDSACVAGECVTGSPYSDSRACMRTTDGDTCGSSTMVCDPCGYTSDCDESAPNVSCRQVTEVCGTSGSCNATEETSLPNETCSRQTDGDVCNDGAGCCNQSGTCSPLAC